MLSKLRTFAAMPVRDSVRTVEAAILTASARLLVAFVPLGQWRRLVAVSRDGATHPAGPADAAAAQAVGRAVRRAVRNLPGEYLCLPQALAANWMLTRRGVVSQLRLGTRRRADGSREHHAWLKVGPTWVTGHCRESDFVVFRKVA